MAKKTKDTETFSNFNVVVFGGDGDLAFRKIYPAMFHRMLDGQINDQFNIVGITRKSTINLTSLESHEKPLKLRHLMLRFVNFYSPLTINPQRTNSGKNSTKKSHGFKQKMPRSPVTQR
ncbi:MAG: hypothetical protein EBU82_08530 [Flavobacteriia bacterium]|nr:hypothetical protein [Flavobacteriia bacterium]